MLDTTTKRRIDDARDILVGKIPDPKSQVEQITIALIYKFMDDMDSESEELGGKTKFFSGEYKKYSWRKVFNQARGGQEILLDYREALQQLSKNPNLPNIFHTIFRQAYLPYNDPETLKSFLKIIGQFEYDHSERLGDAFEYLLSVLGSQGDAGQFRTPRHIIDFMVDIVEPKKGETILDPACGTAGFLISAYKYILLHSSSEGKHNGDLLTPDERRLLSQNITGYDISPDMVRLSLVNMYLHRITEPKITEYDTLTSETKWNEYFDVILANPPFMSPKGGIKPHSHFSIQSKRSEALFVDYIAEHLTLTGRAAVIVPEGVIFKGDSTFVKLRKMLIEGEYLYGVISLPSGIFNPYSGVKTSILLLDKVIAKLTDKIFFAKVENDGFALGAQRRPIEGSELNQVSSMIRDFKTKLHREEEFKSDKCTLVEKSKIAESGDYNLNGERYVIENKFSSNYKFVKLGDQEIFEIQSGGTPDSKNELYWDGDINWATLIDLPPNDFITILSETKRKITESGLQNSSAKLLPKESILVSSRATIGRIAINDIETATNQGFKNIIIKDRNKANYKYVAYVMTYLKSQMEALAIGGTFKEISKSNFATLEIPLPPLKEQQAIVMEIESYQRIIDSARTILKNYHPQICIDSEWPVVELKEICDLNPKKIDIEDYPENMLVSFLPMADLNENNMLCEPQKTKLLKEVYSNYTYFKSNDVLLAKVTPCFENGKAGIAYKLVNNIGFGSSEYYVLRAKHMTTPEWLYFMIKDKSFKVQAKQSMTGTGGLQRIPKNFLSTWKISLPDLEIQKQIITKLQREHEIIESTKDLIHIFEQKITNRITQIWNEQNDE